MAIYSLFNYPESSYVTVLQIVQFIASVGCFFGYLYFTVVEKRECAGGLGIYATMLFNVTLLYSFVQILLKSMAKRKKAA